MTAFRVKGIYYELTLYMDLWNNEILSYSLSAKHGDRMTYISGLNDLLGSCGITHSMSRAGTPTDNAAMESINGWIKSELFTDFHLQGENVPDQAWSHCQTQSREAVHRRFDNGGRPDIIHQTKQDAADSDVYCLKRCQCCKKIKNSCPVFVDKCTVCTLTVSEWHPDHSQST